MKGEEYKNEWPAAWEIGQGLGISNGQIGLLVNRLPIDKVHQGLKAAEAKGLTGNQACRYARGVIKRLQT